MILNVNPDRTLIRAAARSRRYVLISFAAPEAPAAEHRKPANVSLVMDRSGSMGGGKIELVREAVKKALAMLRSDDRFSLVVYDNQIDMLVESTPASAEARANADRKLAGIDARGSTDLAGGWLRGCEQIALHLASDSPGRCLLLTDGLANVGITDHDELERHARELRSRGVTTSTFGVGDDFDEVLLQRMAVAGGGHPYYIETPVQILDLLTSELGETLEIVAHDATVEVALPAGATATCLNEYPASQADGVLRIDLGSLVSRQEVSLAVMLEFPGGQPGSQLEVQFRLKDSDGTLDAPPVAWIWTFADHPANDNQPRDRAVDRAVAELYAALARREAVLCNRAGQFDRAQQVLQATAERIRGYAGEDPVLNALARELMRELDRHAMPMSPSEQKARWYSSAHLMRSRDMTGKSKRRNQPM